MAIRSKLVKKYEIEKNVENEIDYGSSRSGAAEMNPTRNHEVGFDPWPHSVG